MAGRGAVAGVCWTVADGLTGPREPTLSMEIRRPDGALEAGVVGFDAGGFGEVTLSSVGRVRPRWAQRALPALPALPEPPIHDVTDCSEEADTG